MSGKCSRCGGSGWLTGTEMVRQRDGSYKQITRRYRCPYC